MVTLRPRCNNSSSLVAPQLRHPPSDVACVMQASFNRLTSLPDSLAALPRLELCRVACCDIATLPDSLADAPALVWLSLGGNPVCAPPPPHR